MIYGARFAALLSPAINRPSRKCSNVLSYAVSRIVNTYRVKPAVFACLLVLPPVFSSRLVHAQAPVSTTLCAVMNNPTAFAGHIVKLRATVASAFEVSTIVDADDPSCRGPWFEYAPRKGETSPQLDGYDTELQRLHPVFLVEDENMKQFDKDLDAVVYPRDDKIVVEGGAPRYKVTATMTGRVDYVGKPGLGFGHQNGWPVRFVLSSVQHVATEEISYNWAEFSREPVRFPHGTILGKLTDASGRPIKLAWVEAIPAEGKIPNYCPHALTEEDGSYSLNVEPGKYLIVVSRTNPATEEVPVMTTYFPSSETESGATPLVVADGVEVPNTDIQIHRILTPRYFEVEVVWPNGKPASGAYAYLTQTNQAPIVDSAPHTNADGRARLMGFEGLDYLIWADVGNAPRESCARAVHLDPNGTITGPIVLTIELGDEACDKQEDEAASAAYATQER